MAIDAEEIENAATSRVGRRIVFVCQVFYPDTSSTSQLFGPLLEQFSNDGERVLVLSGFPGRTAQAASSLRNESVNGIEIRRSGLAIDYRRNFFLRALSYTAFSTHLWLQLLRIRSGDVVIGVTNPPFTAHILWLASRLRRFEYYYLLHDAYPEGLFALGKLKPTQIASRLWLAANRVAYRGAKKLIVLGRDMVPLLKQNYNIEPNDCIYIPHWSPVEWDKYIEIGKSSMLQRLGLQDKFVVQYSGNMGLWNDMITLVRAAEILRHQPQLHFLFIGDGFRRQEAEELSRSLQLTNITWHDFVPIEELADSLSACDCALISQNDGLEGVAVPCKLYGILASGRAIVAQVPENCEVAMTVRENDCGIVVRPADVRELAKAILTLADSRQLAVDQGQRAFHAFNTKYRLSHAVRAFRKCCLQDCPDKVS